MEQTKYETFRIKADLMALIRQVAKADDKSIRATIEAVLRERFVSRDQK